MTFNEILETGKQNKIDIFEIYTLLEQRQEEISKNDYENLKLWNSKQNGAYKDSDIYKRNEAESLKCQELKSFIKKQNFDIFTQKERSTAYLLEIEDIIFDISLAKKNNDVETEYCLKDKAAKILNSRIKFLESLKERLGSN